MGFVEGEVFTVGITKHATELLGDIVFVEVPDTGKSVKEVKQRLLSPKAASDVYSPISGEITEGNKAIVDDPSSVNNDPEEKVGFKLKFKDKSEFDSLMSKDEYDKFCKRIQIKWFTIIQKNS